MIIQKQTKKLLTVTNICGESDIIYDLSVCTKYAISFSEKMQFN